MFLRRTNKCINYEPVCLNHSGSPSSNAKQTEKVYALGWRIGCDSSAKGEEGEELAWTDFSPSWADCSVSSMGFSVNSMEFSVDSMGFKQKKMKKALA